MSSDSTISTSLELTSTTNAMMTPEQQGIFYNLVKEQPIPSWLSEAGSEARVLGRIPAKRSSIRFR